MTTTADFPTRIESADFIKFINSMVPNLIEALNGKTISEFERAVPNNIAISDVIHNTMLHLAGAALHINGDGNMRMRKENAEIGHVQTASIAVFLTVINFFIAAGFAESMERAKNEDVPPVAVLVSYSKQMRERLDEMLGLFQHHFGLCMAHLIREHMDNSRE